MIERIMNNKDRSIFFLDLRFTWTIFSIGNVTPDIIKRINMNTLHRYFFCKFLSRKFWLFCTLGEVPSPIIFIASNRA